LFVEVVDIDVGREGNGSAVKISVPRHLARERQG
jgi:hypothetical protein